MSRQQGTYKLASNIEPLAAAPLDSRAKVASKSDLTATGTFPYPYEGMEVYVVAEKKKYLLIDDNPTIASNWREVGEGGGGSGSTGASITIDATLLASAWDTTTKQQTVVFTDYESSMGGVIGMPTSATDAQKEAYAESKVNVVSQSGASFTFECESIPAINLPVTLYAGGGQGGSSGKEEYIITLSYDSDFKIYSVDRTPKDIEVALTENKEVISIYENQGVYLYPIMLTSPNYIFSNQFTDSTPIGTGIFTLQLTKDTDTTWETCELYTIDGTGFRREIHSGIDILEEDAIQFTDFDHEDDGEYDVITPHKLTVAEMDDIVDPEVTLETNQVTAQNFKDFYNRIAGSGSFEIHFANDAVDVTYSQLVEALEAGKELKLVDTANDVVLAFTGYYSGVYYFSTICLNRRQEMVNTSIVLYQSAPNSDVVATQVQRLTLTEDVQKTEMPTASSTYLNKIYQYIGTTDTNFTNGLFYRCVNTSGTYSWEECETQHRLTPAEMADIMSTLPGAPTQYPKYSTTEQVIGTWIDGKPIYQKTINFGYSLTNASTQQEWLEPIGALVDRVIACWGNMHGRDNKWGSTLPWNTDGSSYVVIGANTNDESDADKKNKVGIYWKGDCDWITDPIITVQYTKTTD